MDRRYTLIPVYFKAPNLLFSNPVSLPLAPRFACDLVLS